MALDKNWRESKREEEELRGKKEQMGGAPKIGAAIDIATTLSAAEKAKQLLNRQ